MKKMHIGVELTYLMGVVQRLGEKQNVIERSGKALAPETALSFLRRERRKGIRVISNCETPNPDGSCPGHLK